LMNPNNPISALLECSTRPAGTPETQLRRSL
jgi:hypothetical protein